MEKFTIFLCGPNIFHTTLKLSGNNIAYKYNLNESR